MKKDKKIIIGLLILLIVAISAAAFFFLQEDKTAVIVNTDQKLQNVDATNQLRIKINPQIEVKENTMQNLYFQNVNENRYMQCKIKLEGAEEYIYESQLLKQGEIIQADVIDESQLRKGYNDATAEIYTYDLNKEKTAQRDVGIVLVK